MSIRILFLAALLSAGTLHADTLISWENDPLGGNETETAADTTSTGIQTAVLARGAGGTATIYTNTFAMRNADALTLADAILSNRYLTVSLATEPGWRMDLTNLFVRLQAQNATSYEVTFTLMSDLTGLDPADALATWVVGGTGNSSDWLGQERSVDLSGVPGLQDIDAVVFRLYIHGQSGAFTQVGIGRAFQLNGTDDLRISGIIREAPATAEPEVTSFIVSPAEATLNWAEVAINQEITVWWAADLRADTNAWIALASSLASTVTQFVDTIQNSEPVGFYWLEAVPAP